MDLLQAEHLIGLKRNRSLPQHGQIEGSREALARNESKFLSAFAAFWVSSVEFAGLVSAIESAC